MPFCSSCGAEHGDTAQFCSSCGRQIQSVAAALPPSLPVEAAVPTGSGTPDQASVRSTRGQLSSPATGVQQAASTLRAPAGAAREGKTARTLGIAALVLVLAAAVGAGAWFGVKALIVGGAERTGWAVEVSYEDYASTILRTTNGGETWVEMDEVEGLVTQFIPVDDQTCFVVVDPMDSARIIRTTDAGESWTEIRMPDDAPDVLSASFVSAAEGWVVTGADSYSLFGSAVQHTSDGGVTWETQYEVDGNWALGQICFSDADHGWAAASHAEYESDSEEPTITGLVLTTTDGGDTWEVLEVADDFMPLAVLRGADGAGWLSGFYRDSQLEEMTPVLMGTTDGGETWGECQTGESIVLYDNDSDFNATDCLLEAAVSRGSVVDGRHVWMPLLDGPDMVLMYSDDCGETFGTLYSRDNICSVTFVDAEHGWAQYVDLGDEIVGILCTKDGGETWEEPEIALN